MVKTHRPDEASTSLTTTMSSSSTSTTITSPVAVVCRVKLHEHLNQKRISLTPDEFAFAKQVIEQGEESDLQALATTLQDHNLFFGHDHDNHVLQQHQEQKDTTTEEPCGRIVSSTHIPLSPTTVMMMMGSTKRQSRIQARRYCSTQARLWKQAARKVKAASIASVATAGGRPGSPKRDQALSSSSLVDAPNVDNIHCSSKTNAATTDGNETVVASPMTLDSTNDDSKRSDDGLDETITTTTTTTTRTTTQAEEVDLFMPTLLEGGDEENGGSGGRPKEPVLRRLLTRTASFNVYNGQGIEVGDEELFISNSQPHYDPWDEETNRDTGHLYDFHILGTSHYDESVLPHVLSPPLMQALQASLPYSQQGESFWLKYSMVRDGASLVTLLRQVRASTNTMLAMETIDGQVFGAYCSSPWNNQPHFYGSGTSSFAWRMIHSRIEMASSVWEQARRETDLEIFPSQTPLVQLCQPHRLCVGSGTPSTARKVSNGELYNPQDFGFAIALGESLLEVCSSACEAFDSPPLLVNNHGGAPVELVNLEIWALTPFLTEEEARAVEYQRLFLQRNHAVNCSHY